MKFFTHTTNAIKTRGQSLVGYIQATALQMQQVFGAPMVVSNCGTIKFTKLWKIQFEDGAAASIYNWVNDEDAPADNEPVSWRIDGRSHEVVTLIHDAFRAGVGLSFRPAEGTSEKQLAEGATW